ncbi:hypothetical protein PoB_001114800 [Plakobranchus ocellatus]|uniref:Uncharacterized protein n=1 Tax=Plakobranchus ocellatus TaxID=259542 RepID=A0AAV3YQM6_9GAST|nr:hypothetical protein PoB_001114800 [Plakobranchus ocellatus]
MYRTFFVVSVCLMTLSISLGDHQLERFYEKEIPTELIRRLFDLTISQQTKEEIPLKLPLQLYRQKGVFSSAVKLYFHGKPEFAEARRLMNLFDNNMFVTAWVTSSLLEAYRLGDSPKPTEEQIMLALNSFQVHINKNKPYVNSAMTFWPQSFNSAKNYWNSAPVNLVVSSKNCALLQQHLTITKLNTFEDSYHSVQAYEANHRTETSLLKVS